MCGVMVNDARNWNHDAVASTSPSPDLALVDYADIAGGGVALTDHSPAHGENLGGL